MSYTEIKIVIKDSDLPSEGKYTKGFYQKIMKTAKRVEIKSNLIGGDPSLMVKNQLITND